MIRWAQSVCNRNQVVLFSPTLDDAIAIDHAVRLFDEVLAEVDFGDWEAQYQRVDGQPPIHPRVVAAAILYGLSLGIRSSRKLEDGMGNRMDFMWLCHGRVIDHATLAKFRVKFSDAIGRLFRQVGSLAIGMGMANLNQIALDGTAKRSNNSRYKTVRRPSLEQKLAALDQQVDQMMEQWQRQDTRDQELFGESSPTRLPEPLKDIKARQAHLRKAMKKLEQLQARSAGRKDRHPKGPAVPITDPDSSVIKNKSGGFAPNYTIVLATEGQNGFIVDARLPEGNDEASSVIPAMSNIQKHFGHKPREVLADSNFNSGPNLEELQRQGIEPWMPPRQEPRMNKAAGENPRGENPATDNGMGADNAGTQESLVCREDPTQPIPVQLHSMLPVNPQNKVLDRRAFVYDGKQDCYFCPMGRKLAFAGTNDYVRLSVRGKYQVYEAAREDCRSCVLSARCLIGASLQRKVVRDEYEPLREEMAARMQSQTGRAKYRRRSFLCETPYAMMNTTLNFRQFLLRGFEKAGTELMWLCTAMNLGKLVRLLIQRHATAPT
jgi:transposase